MISARLAAAYIETAFNIPTYAKSIKEVKKMDLLLSALPPQIGPYSPHKDFVKRATQFAQEIAQYKGHTAELAINFGDSLVDMYRTRFQSIDIAMSVGGMHHFHMLQMAKTMKPILDIKKLYPKYIMIGTLGGNPLLQHQEINTVVAKSIECLNGLRTMWPAAKLIVYGLPPVVSLYATAHSLKFEASIYGWILKDNNSVFIPMFKSFAGKFNLYPKTYGTADGIHLTPVGMVMLDERFEKAKSAIPKSMVDYCE